MVSSRFSPDDTYGGGLDFISNTLALGIIFVIFRTY